MMRFSLSQQTIYFLSSIVFGAALAVLYDVVRAVRMLIRCSRAHLLVSDILFFFLCGVLTSLFSLPFNKGDVRAFIFFGEAVGFLTYRLTLGSIFGKFYAVIARLLRQFIRKNCEKLKKIYDFLLKAGAVLVYNIVESVDGLRRTALSGVRVLAEQRRQKAGERRSLRRRRAVQHEGKPRNGAAAVPHTTTRVYDLPRPGENQTIDRKYHEQTRSKTPEGRKKRRGSRTERRG